MTSHDRWVEAMGYLKLLVVWVANYFTFTNLNTVLSTGVLILTLGYTWLQIDKLLREREVAVRAARRAALEPELGKPENSNE